MASEIKYVFIIEFELDLNNNIYQRILSFSLIDIATANEPCKFTIVQGDDIEPPPDIFRLYAVSSCPYCERVAIVACKKDIVLEVVNASNIPSIPSRFLWMDTEGLVPVLRHNGKTMNGSRMIIEYLDDVKTEKSILPDEPYLKAKQEYDAFKLESVCDAIREISFKNRLTGNVTLLALELTKAEKMLKSPFYSGEEFGLPDIVLYPFIQRLFMIRSLINDYFLDVYFPLNYPKLMNWFVRMRTFPEIQAIQETDTILEDFKICKGYTNTFPNMGYTNTFPLQGFLRLF
ncbi:glutathione S-transferase protein [Onchocerca flexuosa]|uniref:Glutathione S-transferase omega n=1 Tax=Onchocerca flexuosa TaxID=387005 RepID=A0A238BM57_9BILA|nr:glutathione S-transferase protein [Onchocerca flexuosa]